MQTYYTYNPDTKRLVKARNPATIDGQMVINPTAVMYAKIGAYPLGEAPAPVPPEGKIAIRDGYGLVEGRWECAYRYEDAPPPPLKTYSKYRLVSALMDEGVWPQVKAWIESVPGAYDLYLAAEDISGDEPLLAQGIAEVKDVLGWTDEQVAKVLAQAEVR